MTKDDRACALIILGIAIAACLGATQHVVGTFSDPGPGLFPLGLGVVLGVLSLIILAGGIAAKRAEKGEAESEACARPKKVSKEALYVIGVLIAFGVLLVPLGFILTTFVVFAALLRLVARQGWAMSLGGGAVLAVSSYLLFAMALGVNLPRGILAF